MRDDPYFRFKVFLIDLLLCKIYSRGIFFVNKYARQKNMQCKNKRRIENRGRLCSLHCLGFNTKHTEYGLGVADIPAMDFSELLLGRGTLHSLTCSRCQ